MNTWQLYGHMFRIWADHAWPLAALVYLGVRGETASTRTRQIWWTVGCLALLTILAAGWGAESLLLEVRP